MILDSDSVHDHNDDNIMGYMPAGRVFSSIVRFDNFGSAVMLGGLT